MPEQDTEVVQWLGSLEPEEKAITVKTLGIVGLAGVITTGGDAVAVALAENTGDIIAAIGLNTAFFITVAATAYKFGKRQLSQITQN